MYIEQKDLVKQSSTISNNSCSCCGHRRGKDDRDEGRDEGLGSSQSLLKLGKISTDSHQHRLCLKDAGTPYRCAGCKENERVRRRRYQCEDENCNFNLHEECYSSYHEKPSIVFTFLEKKCDFRFHHEDMPGRRICDACGKGVKGWSYKCKICKKPHYLHPCCAKLPIEKKGDTGLVFKLTSKASSKCRKCKNSSPIKGWSYVSKCGKYSYHVSCFKEMVHDLLEIEDESDDEEDHYSYSVGGAAAGKISSGRVVASTRIDGGAITRLIKRDTAMGFLTEAGKMVVELIFSAIFGPLLGPAFAALLSF